MAGIVAMAEQAAGRYNAGPGYDLAGGVGTVDAAKIVRALVAVGSAIGG